MKCRESRKDFLDRKRAERLKDPNREKKARRTREAVGAITKRFADLLKDQEPITLKSTLIDFKNDMKLKIPKVTKWLLSMLWIKEKEVEEPLPKTPEEWKRAMDESRKNTQLTDEDLY